MTLILYLQLVREDDRSEGMKLIFDISAAYSGLHEKESQKSIFSFVSFCCWLTSLGINTVERGSWCQMI